MRKMLIMPDTVMLARELQASYERAISPAVQQAPHNSRQKEYILSILVRGPAARSAEWDQNDCAKQQEFSSPFHRLTATGFLYLAATGIKLWAATR